MISWPPIYTVSVCEKKKKPLIHNPTCQSIPKLWFMTHPVRVYYGAILLWLILQKGVSSRSNTKQYVFFWSWKKFFSDCVRQQAIQVNQLLMQRKLVQVHWKDTNWYIWRTGSYLSAYWKNRLNLLNSKSLWSSLGLCESEGLYVQQVETGSSWPTVVVALYSINAIRPPRVRKNKTIWIWWAKWQIINNFAFTPSGTNHHHHQP